MQTCSEQIVLVFLGKLDARMSTLAVDFAHLIFCKLHIIRSLAFVPCYPLDSSILRRRHGGMHLQQPAHHMHAVRTVLLTE